ncbi:MAG: GNAT family N-acetyltransferase [Chloroflexota bacterium]|jgi:GNAT superfamily N-acetyltransferase
MAAPALPEVPHDAGRLTAAAAANMAGWHDLHLRSLGHRTEWRDGLWLTPERVPVIFFSAIAVRPGAAGGVVAARTSASTWTAACDPWSDLALAGTGYEHLSDQPWMARPAGPIGSVEPPDGLVVQRAADVGDLVLFEMTAAQGFDAGVVAPHTWHGPAVLADPRLDLWLGLVDGSPVAVSMGFREAGVLGIYGVATIPAARRRGYATALTTHAIDQAPELPAVLQPSTMAEPLYEALGFRRFGSFRSWARGGVG